MTTEELGNDFGYQCPACESGEGLTIHAIRCVQVRLCVGGTDDDGGGDTEWDGNDRAECSDCGWIGTVKDLKQIEVEDVA